MEGLVPDLDLALIPIWGWGPSLGRGLHLDPARAAEAISSSGPESRSPSTGGRTGRCTEARGAWFLREPAEAFVREASARAPDVEVRVLQPGEQLEL